jgi:acetate kinase
MEWAGIVLDAGANCAFGTETRISSPNSQVEMWVIPVDEAQILAREALAVIVVRRLQEGGR